MTLFNYTDFLSGYEKKIGPFKHKGAFAIYYSEIIPSNLMMIGHNPGGDPACENRARNSVKSGFHEYVDNAGGSEESYKLAKIMNAYLRRLLDINSDQIRKIPKINIVFRRSKNAAEFARNHDGLSIWCAAKEDQPFIEEMMRVIQPKAIIFEGIKAWEKFRYLYCAHEINGPECIKKAGNNVRLVQSAKPHVHCLNRPIAALILAHPSHYGNWQAMKEADSLSRSFLTSAGAM